MKWSRAVYENLSGSFREAYENLRKAYKHNNKLFTHQEALTIISNNHLDKAANILARLVDEQLVLKSRWTHGPSGEDSYLPVSLD
ncbi:MAG: hypothetical protein ACP5D2_00755 [Candidatus Nanoarchaeia archaeon]